MSQYLYLHMKIICRKFHIETPNTLNSLREKCPNRSFIWSVFSRIRNEYGDLRSKCGNAEKYGPEKTPYLDTFHALGWSMKIALTDTLTFIQSLLEIF